MYLVLNRLSDDGQQTFGKLRLLDSKDNVILTLDTLELTYCDNQRRISCIPCGVYVVRPRLSYRFGRCFELLNVENRSAILIHKGNFNSDTHGCILVGNGKKDINNDGVIDLYNSTIAMNNLLKSLNTHTTIAIINEWEQ